MYIDDTTLRVCVSCAGASKELGVSFSDADNGEGNCGDAVCIAANMLTSFRADELVYDVHMRAQVLCDVSGSCATAGHMVVYKGETMMMESYCGLSGVTCTKHATVVNSPRMKRRLRVGSRTEGLEFTALAARFRTKMEERLLSGLVRMGV